MRTPLAPLVCVGRQVFGVSRFDWHFEIRINWLFDESASGHRRSCVSAGAIYTRKDDSIPTAARQLTVFSEPRLVQYSTTGISGADELPNLSLADGKGCRHFAYRARL